ncbi:kinesin heavy chain [Sardina pilchardus]|uniref:kinesin heavy chain n=1 Tax=Sardina pilchardus TaxID=27697 RepID=UPI002E0D58AA
MQGYNGCVIAYGSPCSGKTYTMLGGSLTGKQRGILSRVSEDIFNALEASICSVRVSFYHISNEKIYDLLDSQPSEVSRIHEGEDAVVLEGLKEVEVDSPHALLQAYRRGAANRQAGTSKGEFATRSHSIFNIMVVNAKASLAQGGGLTASKLTLARGRGDAALEVKRCFQTVPENPQEAKTLKRSLTIFGNVIFALSVAGCHHIPYRESKLTRVLRDCLGGNCRMSLIVTVSPHLSSVTETLSSLQFASRAMAIPERRVHRSQLQCAPLQLTAQTCLPPIPFGPSSPPFRPGHRQPDEPELKAFLPHLEKQGQFEGTCGSSHFGYPAGRGNCAREEQSTAAAARVVYPAPRRSVERLSATSSRALPCSPASLLDAPGPLAECPNCKRERKIREEYDKFIVQACRDRDSLHQRVTELEARLLARGAERQRVEEEENKEKEVAEHKESKEEEEEVAELKQRKAEEATEISRCNTTEIPANAEAQTPGSAETPQGGESLREDAETQVEGVSSMINAAQLLHLESENVQLKGQILALQQELVVSDEQLDQSAEREKALTELLRAEEARAAGDTQALCLQLDQASLQQDSLREQTERLLSELQSASVEHERFKGNVALSVAQLQKDKDDLMSHLDEVRECYERVKSDNALLSERVETLKREVNHGLHGNSGSSHVHTVTTNTEMLVVSHHVSQQCSGGMNTDSKCCYTSCSEFQERPAPTFPEKPPDDPENPSEQEPGLRKTKDTLKQLKREHSLLLDVMLVLYKREWFTQEAVPYVRRTLSKCGMRVDDT